MNIYVSHMLAKIVLEEQQKCVSNTFIIPISFILLSDMKGIHNWNFF